MKKSILLFLGLGLNVANLAQGDVISEIAINGAVAREVSATDASEWRIQLYHPQTREPIKRFNVLHTRDMHLILIKRDLSTFAHVHPNLIGNTGVFHTILNQASHDPDNEQAKKAIPSAGDYFVFTETAPKDFPELGYIELSRAEVNAPGAWTPEAFRLDPVENGGGHGHHGGSFAIVKYFKVTGLPDPEKPWQKPKDFNVEPGKYGDHYRARLDISMVPGCGGNMVEFHLDVDMWDKLAAAYKSIKELPQWLQMEGHGILLEANSAVPVEKAHFVHIHGMRHDGHDAIMFSHFDRQIMNGKNYRLWMQIKHNGHVLTFPFSFHYMTHYMNECR